MFTKYIPEFLLKEASKLPRCYYFQQQLTLPIWSQYMVCQLSFSEPYSLPAKYLGNCDRMAVNSVEDP